jgi:hypothetical protein
MTHHLLYFPGLATAIAVVACAPSPPAGSPAHASADDGGVEVTTDRSSYRAGDPVTLTVQNGRADTIAFNPCTRTLEAERAGTWSLVPEPQRICTMEAWILGPGERREGPTELPADLSVGRYRAVLAFTVESANPSTERLEARSAPFSLER